MERDGDRECQRQSRTDRWGEKAELKSVAPEQSGAEAKSHESRQIWNQGLSTWQRAGAVGTVMIREEPGLCRGGEGQDLHEHRGRGQKLGHRLG
jgi:hypothetical protein